MDQHVHTPAPTGPASAPAGPARPGTAADVRAGAAPGVRPDADAGVESGATASILAALRVVLHVSFAALLAVGLVRSVLSPGTAAAAVWPAALALAAVYLVGTVAERRRWARRRPVHRGASLAWLALVLLLWGALVALHPDFAWVAFPLFFVVQHVLAEATGRHWPGQMAVAAVTVVVVLASAPGPDGLRPAAVIGPCVGAVVAVVMYQAYRALHLESERQRAVAAELMAARAELARTEHRSGVLAERERLAREIHDTLTQGLASIVLVSRAAEDALDADDRDLARRRLHTVRDTAAENLAESRRFVRDLRGDGRSLVEQLDAAVHGFARRQADAGTPVAADLQVEGTPVPLAEAVESALLRAVQSSLANVGQHAAAARCRVSVAYLDGEVTVDVADDGRGFDPEATRRPVARERGRSVAGSRGRPVPAGTAGQERDDDGTGESTGVGLAALRERVEAVGGRVAVESTPGEGAVVAMTVPVAGRSETAKENG